MSYWLAPALTALRNEVNHGAPNRDKASDGWIGDRAHSASKSDHNPANWPPNWSGAVRALDIDADLNNGVSPQELANRIAALLGKHPALGAGAYVIHRGKIISTNRLREGWRNYTGVNAHKTHIHVSVGTSPSAYNSTAEWNIWEDEDMALSDSDVRRIALGVLGYTNPKVVNGGSQQVYSHILEQTRANKRMESTLKALAKGPLPTAADVAAHLAPLLVDDLTAALESAGVPSSEDIAHTVLDTLASRLSEED